MNNIFRKIITDRTENKLNECNTEYVQTELTLLKDLNNKINVKFDGDLEDGGQFYRVRFQKMMEGIVCYHVFLDEIQKYRNDKLNELGI